MQALQIRGQLDAIGHDRRVRLELGDETSRAYRAQRRDIGDIAFIDETLQDILGRNRLPGDLDVREHL